MSLLSWNINGWTEQNKLLRSEILLNINSDFVCLCETHLHDDTKISIPGYKWFGYNRPHRHVKARKGSGGVGILVLDKVCIDYDINIVDKIQDGILGILCTHKISNFKIAIFSCYLPPENSPYGKQAEYFFNHLLQTVYLLSNVDQIFIMGDFNAKTGNTADTLDTDNILTRKYIDLTKNSHGESLIDFLHDSKTCILNGRLSNSEDGYTFVSPRGKSVVDYIITNHDNLSNCLCFKVHYITDLVEKFKLESYLSDTCKIPDHAILYTETLTCIEITNDNIVVDRNVNNGKYSNDKFIFKLHEIPDHFFSSLEVSNYLNFLSESLLNNLINIDEYYNGLMGLLNSEMINSIPYYRKTSNRNSRKRSKPYWDQNLSKMWANVKVKERFFRKCTSTVQEKSKARLEFQLERSMFDKLLRTKARQYNVNKIKELESLVKCNYKEFWCKVKQLGPNTKITSSKFGVKIDGNISEDPQIITQKWYDDYSKLYSGSPYDVGILAQSFYNIVLNLVESKEQEMKDQNYVQNGDLNKPISSYEM